jgi:hypothetical protein
MDPCAFTARTTAYRPLTSLRCGPSPRNHLGHVRPQSARRGVLSGATAGVTPRAVLRRAKRAVCTTVPRGQRSRSLLRSPEIPCGRSLRERGRTAGFERVKAARMLTLLRRSKIDPPVARWSRQLQRAPASSLAGAGAAGGLCRADRSGVGRRAAVRGCCWRWVVEAAGAVAG